MLTGTPLDLTPFGDMLGGIAALYWLLVFSAIFAALWFPKYWLIKFVLTSSIVGITVVPVVIYVIDQNQERAKRTAQLNKAMAHFEMRCKSAGEKITRTVENVEGIFLMKVRQNDKYDDQNTEQFRMNDPYGKDSTGDEYIASFLYQRNVNGGLFLSAFPSGYRFIEAIDPNDEKLYRYTILFINENIYKLIKILPNKQRPMFGISYDDISTKEDRAMWVAGSALRVIDLKTNEVIAERIGYMIDRGQGSTAGFREPWFFAAYNACPKFPLTSLSEKRPNQSYQTRNFVEKVLKPLKQEGQ